MKEESKDITLSLGDVSWKMQLDKYYIDMRPSLVHYHNNIYDGKFDENGVPMIGLGNGQYNYFPINVAQYGFMIHADYIDKKDEKLLLLLKNCLAVLENLKIEDKNTAVWWHQHYEIKYKIEPPWASAMAQGEVISFYLRMYQILNDKNLLDTAQKAYRFMQDAKSPKSVRIYDEKGDLWFEEYPSKPPSYVLNGFIYALWGLIDLYRVTNDETIKKDIDACVKTLKNNLHKFDSGYWSYYDLQKKELVRYYYQKNVHVPQLEVLHILFSDELFKKYLIRWKNYVNPVNYVFVQLMYRIKPRLKKIYKWIN